MKRKSPSKVQPIPLDAQKLLPARQLKAMRRFGIRQLAAALELVGTGEQFIDQSLAIGLALKIQREKLSSAQLSDIQMEGAEYLLSRGILELAPPQKPKHGDVDVVIRAPTTHTALIEELIAAGLKARNIGSDGLITEFKGRLPRDSGLPDKVRSCHGTVAFIENRTFPIRRRRPAASHNGGQGEFDAATTIALSITGRPEPANSQAIGQTTAPGSKAETPEQGTLANVTDAIVVDFPPAPQAVSRTSAYISETRELSLADVRLFCQRAQDEHGSRSRAKE